MIKEIDVMIEEFKAVNETKEPCNAQIAVRIPETSKAKYDEVQLSKDNKLSKLISQAVVKIINSVS